MRRKNSNIGETGPDSIRLGDRRIENLPIAESIRAQEQLPEVYKSIRKTKEAAIRARYPTQHVSYLRGRIKECHTNIKRIRQFREDQRDKASEYRVSLVLCEQREKMKALVPECDDREQRIAEICKQFPLYNIEAMQQQIEQFEESVTRSDDVIGQEHASIAELSEVLVLARRRDEELRRLGE